MQSTATPGASTSALDLREQSRRLTVENIPITLIDQGSGTPTLLLHGLFDSAEGLGLLLNHWRKICGKDNPPSGVTDPLAERERRYDALAEHFRSNLKMDVIYRALDEQR